MGLQFGESLPVSHYSPMSRSISHFPSHSVNHSADRAVLGDEPLVLV